MVAHYMITAMFFGDIIIKKYYSAGEVHVRGVIMKQNRGPLNIFFVCLFSVLGGLFTR